MTLSSRLQLIMGVFLLLHVLQGFTLSNQSLNVQTVYWHAMPELLHSWSHVKGAAHVATYNAGGTYILSGGQDRAIKLVNSTTGSLVNTYSGHGYEVLGIAVSHDNSRFASCGGDRGCVKARACNNIWIWLLTLPSPNDEQRIILGCTIISYHQAFHRT